MLRSSGFLEKAMIGMPFVARPLFRFHCNSSAVQVVVVQILIKLADFERATKSAALGASGASWLVHKVL